MDGREVKLVVCALVVVAVLGVVLWALTSNFFVIKRITVNNEGGHVTSATVERLVDVPSGTRLFSVDTVAIAQAVMADPWVATVEVTRVFPDQLRIHTTERTQAAVVMLASGTEAWRISSDGYWLEAVAMQEGSPMVIVAPPAEQAYAAATADGLIYITDVSAKCSPVAGKKCEDAGVSGVLTYMATFGETLSGQIRIAKASSQAGISVILASGIEIALGAPTDVLSKERVVLSLIDAHPGEITFINVRVPSRPVWQGANPDSALDNALTTAIQSMQTVPAGFDIGGSGLVSEDDGVLVGMPEGGPGGYLDEDGHYDEYGTWIYSYHDPWGNYIYGFYDEVGNWIPLA